MKFSPSRPFSLLSTVEASVRRRFLFFVFFFFFFFFFLFRFPGRERSDVDLLLALPSPSALGPVLSFALIHASARQGLFLS